MEAEGNHNLAREVVSATDISFLREIEMRYVGQSYELGIACPGGPLTLEVISKVIARFHLEHERAYGHGYPEQSVELVNFRVTAIGAITKPILREISHNGDEIGKAQKGSRLVYFSETGDFTETAVYDRYRLAAGHRFVGPVVVEEMDSTSLIHPGFHAEVDRFGNLLVAPNKDAVL
jgi:N-methylhydantoinase A